MKRLPELAALLVAAVFLRVDPACAKVAEADQSVEAVITADGRRHEGLIESESSSWVNLIEIQRRPGKPMSLLIRPIDRSRVVRVVRLNPPQRDTLRRQVDQFVNRARIEAGRMEAIELGQSQRAGIRYYHYSGPWFTLDASTDDNTARRIIVRVEQVFTAFRQVLAPREKPERGLHLIVFGSLEEYHQYLGGVGLKIENRACFVASANLLLAGTELGLYSAELARVAVAHQRLRKELETLEKQLPERLQRFSEHLKQSGLPSQEIARLLNQEKQRANKEIADHQRQVQASDRKNSREFEKVAGQVFTRLYHEAFHAYLENFVFPRAKYEVPRWLNEGLAVTVEGGQLESGVLRVDAPERTSLRRLQADLAAAPLALADLFKAGPEAFLTNGERTRAATQRYYAAAWGVAYYLSFEKHLLTGPRLEQYVRPGQAGTPESRFERLVGMPLVEFEKSWRAYIAGL
jgi:hypothetical protein